MLFKPTDFIDSILLIAKRTFWLCSLELPQPDQHPQNILPANAFRNWLHGYCMQLCFQRMRGLVFNHNLSLSPFLRGCGALLHLGPSLTCFSGRYWQLADQYIYMVIVFCDTDSASSTDPLQRVQRVLTRNNLLHRISSRITRLWIEK